MAFVFLLTLSNTLCKINDKYEAKMVSALWRHGARTSRENIFKISEDKALDAKDLTGNGARMHYILGRQLSKYEYPDLFKSTEPRRYLIYSTQAERTMLSAYSLAMGLLPPGVGPETTPDTAAVEDKLKIQLPPWKGVDPSLIPNDKKALPHGALPVPVVSVNPIYDTIFNKGMDHICPGAYKKQQKITEQNMKDHSTIFDETFKVDLDKNGFKLEDYYPDIAKVNNQWDLTTMGYITDELKAYYNYMGQYPPNAGDFAWKLKYTFGIYMIEWDYTDDNTLKLWTDGMSKRIIAELDERISKVKSKVKKKKRLNFFGLSGHESNVLPFMLGYKLTSEECMLKILKSGKDKTHTSLSDTDLCLASPDFASNFIWELSTKKDIPEDKTHDPAYHYIRVLYNGEALTNHCPRESIEDGEYCPYSVFRAAEIERFQFKSENQRFYACNNINAPMAGVKWKKFAFILLGVFIIQIAILVCLAVKKTNDHGDLLSQNLSMDMGNGE